MIPVSLSASGISCRLLICLTLPRACATVFTGHFSKTFSWGENNFCSGAVSFLQPARNAHHTNGLGGASRTVHPTSPLCFLVGYHFSKIPDTRANRITNQEISGEGVCRGGGGWSGRVRAGGWGGA